MKYVDKFVIDCLTSHKERVLPLSCFKFSGKKKFPQVITCLRKWKKSQNFPNNFWNLLYTENNHFNLQFFCIYVCGKILIKYSLDSFNYVSDD